jgi:hypothetical protein
MFIFLYVLNIFFSSFICNKFIYTYLEEKSVYLKCCLHTTVHFESCLPIFNTRYHFLLMNNFLGNLYKETFLTLKLLQP